MYKTWFVLAGAVALTSPSARAQCLPELELVLTNGGTTITDFVGLSVALDGDLALVGAPYDDDAGGNVGTVYALRRGPNGWEREGKLFPIPSVVQGHFGWSVAIRGTTAVVGARGDSAQGTRAGAAHVFVRQGGVWMHQAELLASDGTAEDWFGSAVAVHGDTVLVGAPWKNGDEEHSGAAYVFVRQGTVWTEETRLVPASDDDWGQFGAAVALEGETAIVGAPGGANGSGRAHVFERTGSSWSLVDELAGSNSPYGAWVGSSLALDAGVLLVGAPGRNVPGAYTAGAVYVFEERAGVWAEREVVFAETPKNNGRFGRSVALSGQLAVVGADGAPTEVLRDAGGGWELDRTILPSTFAKDFGRSVAVAGKLFAIGAPLAQPGKAFVYLWRESPVAYCTAKTNSLGCLPSVDFVGCPSASASSGFNVLGRDVRNQRFGLFFYSLSARAALPFQGGLLCALPPIYRAPTVNSRGHLPPIDDCSGVLRTDMNAFAAGLLGGTPRPELRMPGTVYRGQWWSRDAGDAFGTSLTDALEVRIGP